MSDDGDSRGSSIAGGTPQWTWFLLLVLVALPVAALVRALW